MLEALSCERLGSFENDNADALVDAAAVLLGASRYNESDAPPLSPQAVVRGLLRLTQLCGLQPRDAAGLALAVPELLATPAERLVRTMLLLRRLFPHANLARVVEQLPQHVLLSDDAAALEIGAHGVLCELRLLLPEPLVHLLAQEEPTVLFGGFNLVRREELVDAYEASGLRDLTEAQLADGMRNTRFVQYFVNRFVVS